jgi:hypothetical protein
MHILCFLLAGSKIPHFHRPRLLPFDGVVCDTDGSCVVTMYWYFWLDMSKVFKGEFKYHPFLAI